MVGNRVLVTGGTGMVGSSVPLNMKYETIYVGSSDCDLRNLDKTKDMINDLRPAYVIHLAARVGGVHANMRHKGQYYFDNILMNTNVLESCRIAGVEKVVSLLSTCVYPDDTSYPLVEDYIHDGIPHHSNYPYAYAKRMLDVQSRAYREQYGCNFITAIPNNIYGPNDNFSLNDSHVVPAIIRKVWEAIRDESKLTLWGDGTPLREFTYSKDIGSALWFLLENYNDDTPINIGNTHETSIKELASIVCGHMGYSGEIIWDTTKPKGQHKKPSSNKKFLNLGWDNNSYTTLDEGIKLTCDWFVNNHRSARGL